MSPYALPAGGLPPQTALHTGRAVFTEAYAVIPRAVMSDIVTSLLPGWTGARFWIIARPMTGFAESFAHLVGTLDPGGGAPAPEPEPGAEGVVFVVCGTLRLTLGGQDRDLPEGGYAWLPPGPATFHWIRKLYEPAPGIPVPPPLFAREQEVAPVAMPGTAGTWATTRFVDPADLGHDMHVNIVTFQPGGLIPFEETHVMEHGLYVLEGKAVYRLNRDWVEVEAGDYMWLRAFCPQACYAGGPGRFRYLLYKDVNRQVRLRGPGAFGAAAR